jgi:signal transducing adaptor molecule
LELIQQWAFEFRADPSLGIMDETYQQLRSQSKFKFPSPQKPKKELKVRFQDTNNWNSALSTTSL